MTKEESPKTYFSNQHIVQGREWGEFKTLMGTRALTIGNAQLTMHKIPFTPWRVGYCPKVRPENLDLERLYKAARNENLIFVKLDVPHAPSSYQLQTTNYKLVTGKPVFAQSTILVDLTKPDEELLANMHEKTRYNLRLAQRKGLVVRTIPEPLFGGSASGQRSLLAERPIPELEEFIRFQKETAKRQKFFIHPDHYYRACFELLSARGLAFLLSGSVADRLPESTDVRSSATAASWMLFRYGDVLYYPYGESNYEMRSCMASNLLMWEAIQLGKKLGCKVFDLWGSASDPDDKADPWHGFTHFKMSFGGLHLKLAATADLIINPVTYRLFNTFDDIRWRIMRRTR